MDDTDDVLIPYHRLNACSVSFTSQRIPEEWEPNGMSVPNIRRMLTRGRAAVNKEALACIVEFGSGQVGDLNLTSKLNKMSLFKEMMKEEYLKRGRRCMDLPFAT